MDPAELAAGMAAADGQLTPPRRAARPELDDRADRVDVRRRLPDPERDPVGRALVAALDRADVAPQAHRRAVRRLDKVESAVDVEVDERRPAAAVEAHDPRDVGDLAERAFRLAEQEVARVLHGEVGHVDHVALRDVQVDEAVVVDVVELGVPGRRRQVRIASGERLGDVDAVLQPDVLERGPARSIGEGLELVRRLAREVDLGQAVAREVVAGDAHALDLRPRPALFRGVRVGWLTGRDPPELLLADGLAVVRAIVADPEIAPARPIPITEQDGQGAVARREGDRASVAVAGCRRPEQLVHLAARVEVEVVRLEVVAEREARELLARLPRRAERLRHLGAAVDAPDLVRPFEAAVAEAAQRDVLAPAEGHEVDHAVAVDIDGVGAVDRGEIRHGVGQPDEPERVADVAVVPVQRRRPLAAGEVQVLAPVVVAIEHGKPGADRVLERAVVREVHAGAGGVVDEPRGGP